MSWTFQLENINRSFERIASWYKEFMHRTELCFRELHERIMYLEQRQASQGPTDEQIERVIRKILAEKFAASNTQLKEHAHATGDDKYFVESPRDHVCPPPVPFDPLSLVVEPDSVPSKAYADTFGMLESGIARFPQLLQAESRQQCVVNNLKREVEVKQPRSSDSD